ncbi:MAG TPA: DUF1697 domain-containing protein [Candidatus Paceibacterota bacterium]
MPKISNKKETVLHVAFLRGVNVGGNRQVPMLQLKEVFEELGFKNVRTVLASGNVIFESARSNSSALWNTRIKIEKKLKKTFGFEIGVHLRTMNQVVKMLHAKPFKNTKITPETRLYVTFVQEGTKNKIKIPHISPDKSLQILKITGEEVLSILDLEKNGTADAMNMLQKLFGKNITTRNWNTIVKLAVES